MSFCNPYISSLFFSRPKSQNLEIPYNYSLNPEAYSFSYKFFLKKLLNMLENNVPLNTLFKGEIGIIERQLVIYEIQSQGCDLLRQYKLCIDDKDFNQALQNYCEKLGGFKKL